MYGHPSPQGRPYSGAPGAPPPQHQQQQQYQQQPQYQQQQYQQHPPQQNPNYPPGAHPQRSDTMKTSSSHSSMAPAAPRKDAPCPPGADPRLWYCFNAIDSDGSGELSPEELQKALVNGDWQPFNIDTVRMMMGMFDRQRRGVIIYEEFAGLWKYIEDWKTCFQSFDQDSSGTIDAGELQRALLSFGYNLSDHLIQVLVNRYDKRSQGAITFDNFIQACVNIKAITRSFRSHDDDGDGWVTINYEQFVEMFMGIQ